MSRIERSLVRRLASPASLLLIGYTALALASVRVLSHEPRPSQPALLQDELARFEWVDNAGRDGPLLAFVFSFRDCSAALRVGRIWSTLHRAGRASVRGVMLDGPSDAGARARFLAKQGIEFPVSLAPDDQLAAALVGLGYDTTPVTILADDRLRVRLIGPAALDSMGQTALMEVVHAQLDYLSGPSALR